MGSPGPSGRAEAPSLRSELWTLHGCARPGPLVRLADARAMLAAASRAARLTVLKGGGRSHKFRTGGQGLTAFVLLSQSHLALHTWPESATAVLEFLSYADRPIEPALEVVRKALRPSHVSRRSVGGLSFTEEYGPDASLSLRAAKVLASETTPFQSLQLFDSRTFGPVLALDDRVQTTARDEFCYHELLVQPAMHAHPAPARVAIVGGGDLGAAREALKHPHTEVDLFEIDPRVIEVSLRHLPWARAVRASPRLRVHIEDGYRALAGARGSYDVVIVDATDPDPGALSEGLFSRAFYATVRRSLGRAGVLATHLGSPWYYGPRHAALHRAVASAFPSVVRYAGPVPSYPFGVWTFAVAGSRRAEFRAPMVACRLYRPELIEAGREWARALDRADLDLSGRSTFRSRASRRTRASPRAA
jgi:spermidine synthase